MGNFLQQPNEFYGFLTRVYGNLTYFCFYLGFLSHTLREGTGLVYIFLKKGYPIGKELHGLEWEKAVY